MTQYYRDLDTYSDIVEFANRINDKHKSNRQNPPGTKTGNKILEVLGFDDSAAEPVEITIDDSWLEDGLECEEISWSVGYGPRTRAWFFKPETTAGSLPGILALHDHGGIKYYGKDKIAKGKQVVDEGIIALWDTYYGGRPFANALAREGFAVLVHDVFSWGSRRFTNQAIGDDLFELSEASSSIWKKDPELNIIADEQISLYNYAARHHEPLLEKYCILLGSSFAGIVNYEDRMALQYLRSRGDVDTNRIGCIGLSGGGCRAGLLHGVSDTMKATVIAGMMSTYRGLLDHNVRDHSNMFFPAGWARHGDWTDLVAAGIPKSLLVQYNREDPLFTPSGMHESDKLLSSRYADAGKSLEYEGHFYPGPHKFDLEMQDFAFGWLANKLK